MTPTDTASAASEAASVIEQATRLATEKTELIARLRAQRDDIDAALVALGARRQRKTKSKAGRPAGSKNRPKAAPEVAA